jgi:hypothetical protein
LATGPAPKCHFVPGLPNGSPKIPKVGISMILGAHNFVWKPLTKMRFKEKLYPLSRAFQWYVACHLHKKKSQRFLIFSGNLILGPSFGHNLRFMCSNGSCELILDIYIPRAFSWYKELLNPIGSDLYNCFLKIQKSIRTPTSKMGVHLRVWGFILSHFLTLPKT